MTWLSPKPLFPRPVCPVRRLCQFVSRPAFLFPVSAGLRDDSVQAMPILFPDWSLPIPFPGEFFRSQTIWDSAMSPPPPLTEWLHAERQNGGVRCACRWQGRCGWQWRPRMSCDGGGLTGSSGPRPMSPESGLSSKPSHVCAKRLQRFLAAPKAVAQCQGPAGMRHITEQKNVEHCNNLVTGWIIARFPILTVPAHPISHADMVETLRSITFR